MDNQQKLTVVSDAQVEAIGDKIGGNWLPFLMDMQLSRNYLNSMANPAGWNIAVSGLNDSFGWVQLERLPMEPQQGRNTLRAWQSVLSACHTLGLKTAFVLRRVNGRTKIYLGIGDGWDNKAAAVNLLKQCVSLHLPGAALTEQGANFSMPEELDGVGTCSGLITGIPSLQAEQGQPILQTLDTLSRGVLSGGGQKNYALVVVADPAQDAEISELQQKLLRIKSEIHTMASYSETQGKTDGTSEGSSHNKRTGLAMVMGLINAASVVSFYTGNVLGHLGMTALSTLMSSFIGDTGANNSKSQSLSQSLNREHRDFTVQYCEKLIDKHIARMEGGRSLGFWQVGVSVLGEERATVDAVLALLRSVYSGNDSYVEPIRVLNTTGNESMRQLICNQRFVPLPVQRSEGWHVLGRMYESLTTPMTTQELSIATSLPHMDVPGLRTVRNGVHFAMNPASVRRENAIVLGKLMDMGVQQTQDYQMDINALVRHTLVAGSTGSGKSTTCKRILCSVLDKGIPVMIIEPAKDDYVHWALELNRTLPPERQFTIYMPGAEAIEGVESRIDHSHIVVRAKRFAEDVLDADRFEHRADTAASDNARTEACGTEHYNAAVKFANHFVRDCRVFEADCLHAFASSVGRFLDSVRNFLRLAIAETDFARAVAEDDERRECKAASAFYDFRATVDVHDFFDKLRSGVFFCFGFFIFKFSAHYLNVLEVYARGANSVGKALYAAVISARASVEYYCGNACRLEFVSEFRTERLRSRDIGENFLAVEFL